MLINTDAMNAKALRMFDAPFRDLTICEKRVVLAALENRPAMPTGRAFVIDGFRIPEIA